MTQKERILAAIQKEETDRMPFGMWYHIPHVDQDPVALVELQLEQAREQELDFIKMMPFGNYQAADYGLSCTYYCTPTQAVFERKFAIDDVQEWGDIRELPGCFGNHGKTLMMSRQMQRMQKQRGLDLPYVQTIFSPLTIAKKLAGNRIFADMVEHPDLMHHALNEIMKTNINFVKENIDAGVSGFFFASQCSTRDLMTEELYQEFGVKYDLPVLEAAKEDTWFNIVHIHGDNTMFELMASYPVQCVNWHDRWAAPSLDQARKLTDKCLMGGINERWLQTAKAEDVEAHLRQAVEMGGRKGLILTPGCVAKMDTPKENFAACTAAVKKL